MFNSLLRWAFTGVLAAVAAQTASASFIVGVADSNTCAPFACPGGATEYQQLYAASAFPAALTISGLTFIQGNQYGAALSDGTFTVRLSTVSVDPLDLSGFIPVGFDNTQLFSGPLPAFIPFFSSFTLGGQQFSYNPTNGNLLLDVLISGATTDFNPFVNGFFPAQRPPESSVVFSSFMNSPLFISGLGVGLVTQFETVPEPSSQTLLLLAGAVSLLIFRRRVYRG
jgi:hypothetical protein